MSKYRIPPHRLTSATIAARSVRASGMASSSRLYSDYEAGLAAAGGFGAAMLGVVAAHLCAGKVNLNFTGLAQTLGQL
jgi:hypothetical protein